MLISFPRNRIEEIPSYIFKGLNNLVHVNLEYNRIVTIGPNVLTDIPSLKVVFLYGNSCTNDTIFDNFAFNLNVISKNLCFHNNSEEKFHTDIVGGDDQQITEMPFAAQIFKNENFQCTGSVLNKVAFCLQNDKSK